MRSFKLLAIGNGILFFLITLLLSLPQTGQTSDKISSALYPQGTKIVEKAIIDDNAKKIEFHKQGEEEMDKSKSIKNTINRLQRKRHEASKKLELLKLNVSSKQGNLQ